MEYKSVLISVLVFCSVSIDSFSFNGGNENQAKWSSNGQINSNTYDTNRYSSWPKASVLQNGYNSQWGQSNNLAQKLPIISTQGGSKNFAAGLWNNQRSTQQLQNQIYGKTYGANSNTVNYAYPNTIVAQQNPTYPPSIQPTAASSVNYNNYLQNVLPVQTNQYSPKPSSSNYIPWPIPDNQSPQASRLTPSYNAPQILPVSPVTASGLQNPGYGPVYKDQDTIVPTTQSPVVEHPVYDKPFIIVHENGTYENVDNLNNIKWDEHNRAHLISKEPPKLIIAIIELEGVQKPENETALEVPYDTGITKIPQDQNSNLNSGPQNYNNPTVHTTTLDPLKYFIPEYLVPIQTTTENSISYKKNEYHHHHFKTHTTSTSQNNYSYFDSTIKNINNNTPDKVYITPNNISNTDITNSSPYMVNNYYPKIAPNEPYSTGFNSKPYTATDITPNTGTYKPYGTYNNPNSVTDSPLNIGTNKPYPAGNYNNPNFVTDSPSDAGTYNPYPAETYKPYLTGTFNNPKSVIDSPPNVGTYKTYPAETYNSPNSVTDSPSIVGNYIPYPAGTYNSPNSVTDSSSNVVTYKPNSAGTYNNPYSITDNPSNVGTYKPYPTGTYNSPNYVTDSLLDIGTHKPYPAGTYNNPSSETESPSNVGTYIPYPDGTYNSSNSVTDSSSNVPTLDELPTSKPNSAGTYNKPYSITDKPSNVGIYKPYPTATYNSPNSVADSPSDVGTYKSYPAGTYDNSYSIEYNPPQAATDTAPSVTTNTPYTTTERTPNGANYNKYTNNQGSATDSPLYNPDNTQQYTTTDYNTNSNTSPSTDTYQNPQNVDNNNTEETPSKIPTTYKPDIGQATSGTDAGSNEKPLNQYDSSSTNTTNDLQLDQKEPNTNNEDYDLEGSSSPTLELSTPGTFDNQNYPQNGFYSKHRRYYTPYINSNDYGINRPSDLSTGFYNRPAYYRPGPYINNNGYKLKEPSNPTSDLSASDTDASDQPTPSENGYNNNNPAYKPDQKTNNDNSPEPDSLDTPTEPQNGFDENNPTNYNTGPNTNIGDNNDDDIIETSDPQSDVWTNNVDQKNGNDSKEPVSFDSKPNNDGDDDVIGTSDAQLKGFSNQPGGNNNNGPSYHDSKPNDDNDNDYYDTTGPLDENSGAPYKNTDLQEYNNAPIDYEPVIIRNPPRLNKDLKVDPSQLKKVIDDKPVVWFRQDESFWDKVAKGDGAYDSLSIYNVNCKPMLIERTTTVHHYANGTKVVEYVDSIWDSPDAPSPREIKAKRVFQDAE